MFSESFLLAYVAAVYSFNDRVAQTCKGYREDVSAYKL